MSLASCLRQSMPAPVFECSGSGPGYVAPALQNYGEGEGGGGWQNIYGYFLQCIYLSIYLPLRPNRGGRQTGSCKPSVEGG